ncbi:MAG: GNAT family N-acetyltransferase [Deltaproteobacteria bacterium]|nr:GNAT family N-acetyltransferase [Deltaproteobacteria bacterium]
MTVRIQEVANEQDLSAFLAFPRRRYAGDLVWVPPLEPWLRHRLSRRNPFFAEASLALFLAVRDGEVVGTISALRDRLHEEHRGEQVAFFGFFETVDDPVVVRALLGAAEARARAWGATALRGPRNLTRVEENGLLIEGFERPQPFMAGHHPPSYRALVEAEGFVKHHDQLAYETPLVDAEGRPRSLPGYLAEGAAQATDVPGLVVRTPRWRRLTQDLDLVYRCFLDAYRSAPDNTPMPRAQFLHLGRAFVVFAGRSLVQIATVEGRPAGFAVCLPELNEAIHHARGRVLPIGWARMLAALPRIRTASFKLIGVLPEFRGQGIHMRLIREIVLGVQRAGYLRMEGSLIDERNGPMRAVVEGIGLTVFRRYRLYERPVAGQPPA